MINNQNNIETRALKHSPAKMALLALGVVFGDIGTSPLYAIRECFHGEYGITVAASAECPAAGVDPGPGGARRGAALAHRGGRALRHRVSRSTLRLPAAGTLCRAARIRGMAGGQCPHLSGGGGPRRNSRVAGQLGPSPGKGRGAGPILPAKASVPG